MSGAFPCSKPSLPSNTRRSGAAAVSPTASVADPWRRATSSLIVSCARHARIQTATLRGVFALVPRPVVAAGHAAGGHEPARRGGKMHLRGPLRVRDGSALRSAPNASYALQMHFPVTGVRRLARDGSRPPPACPAAAQWWSPTGATLPRAERLQARRRGSRPSRVGDGWRSIGHSPTASVQKTTAAATSADDQPWSAAPWQRAISPPRCFSGLSTATASYHPRAMDDSPSLRRYRKRSSRTPPSVDTLKRTENHAGHPRVISA